MVIQQNSVVQDFLAFNGKTLKINLSCLVKLKTFLYYIESEIRNGT